MLKYVGCVVRPTTELRMLKICKCLFTVEVTHSWVYCIPGGLILIKASYMILRVNICPVNCTPLFSNIKNSFFYHSILSYSLSSS